MTLFEQSIRSAGKLLLATGAAALAADALTNSSVPGENPPKLLCFMAFGLVSGFLSRTISDSKSPLDSKLIYAAAIAAAAALSGDALVAAKDSVVDFFSNVNGVDDFADKVACGIINTVHTLTGSTAEASICRPC